RHGRPILRRNSRIHLTY
ncbi:hypothetical protein CISIN_1g0488141mg, partial [Citrus sinensis]